ncbi:holo-[acyl-carrier protein] synthase [Amycolatopsis bartoniae]|uniref:Holo-[acyl-carrier-protein] synthase n=1 Tax=Amycolatopsis bartoniae TaxID=941986 RepID=A0A8H9IWI4_9PSEU|nr:holo-ACP synthase [Amycolatopsis bartoniae]MBB2938523.1 holo-[acyl-carrier protein] synthase [Amycolatopsis bartoniae]GHF70396.1 hypothetical protein GCM10017566_50220 [Amycolatopsis bartoniae]
MTATAPAVEPAAGRRFAGVGVDVLYLGELDRLLRRPRFHRLMYSPGELRTAATLAPARRREFLGGRFAAKEAVGKVLGTGLLCGIPPACIEVRRRADGAPEVRLSGAAARRAAEIGVGHIALSLSHKDELVVAVALGGPGEHPPADEAGTLAAELEAALAAHPTRKEETVAGQGLDRNAAGAPRRRGRALRRSAGRRRPDAAAVR